MDFLTVWRGSLDLLSIFVQKCLPWWWWIKECEWSLAEFISAFVRLTLVFKKRWWELSTASGAADLRSDLFKGGKSCAWMQAYLLAYSGIWLTLFFCWDIILALLFEDLISSNNQNVHIFSLPPPWNTCSLGCVQIIRDMSLGLPRKFLSIELLWPY